ncbi:hypothetical protein CNEO2_480008 [Clostridium neonatale]|nr:hypothetical protein CNEO2_480008 [Clostridium neonatale]
MPKINNLKIKNMKSYIVILYKSKKKCKKRQINLKCVTKTL